MISLCSRLSFWLQLNERHNLIIDTSISSCNFSLALISLVRCKRQSKFSSKAHSKWGRLLETTNTLKIWVSLFETSNNEQKSVLHQWLPSLEEGKSSNETVERKTLSMANILFGRVQLTHFNTEIREKYMKYSISLWMIMAQFMDIDCTRIEFTTVELWFVHIMVLIKRFWFVSRKAIASNHQTN